MSCYLRLTLGSVRERDMRLTFDSVRLTFGSVRQCDMQLELDQLI